MADTSDCKFFLSQQANVILDLNNWYIDPDVILEQYGYEDHQIVALSDQKYNEIIRDLSTRRRNEAIQALSSIKDWKRRSKSMANDYHEGYIAGSWRTIDQKDIASIRVFECAARDPSDPAESLFDGQIVYEVLELTDGQLILGGNVGD